MFGSFPRLLPGRWSCFWLLMVLGSPGAWPAPEPPPPDVIVVQGLAGEVAYEGVFAGWADQWRKAALKAGANFQLLGAEPKSDPAAPSTRELLQKVLQSASASKAPLWLILLGHGTFDGRMGRFNLNGPDLTAEELGEWVRPLDRPVAILLGFSTSAPFLKPLSGPRRAVAVATKSGFERNFSRFGGYFSQAVAGLEADLDKDGQVSFLEAFLFASHQVEAFYEQEGRLATEHPLLDDNGDGLGTPGDFFRGIRAVKKPAGGAFLDGAYGRQWHLVLSEAETRIPPEIRARRDALELQVARLRESKDKLAEPVYYQQLEALLVKLARLYQDLPSPPPGEKPGG